MKDRSDKVDSRKVDLNRIILIVILNTNGKNIPIKRERLSDCRQKTNKNIENLNITINQHDLTDINRILNTFRLHILSKCI